MIAIQNLLLCTNGSPASQAALDYGGWLARALRVPATVLGIVETPASQNLVEDLVQKAVRRMSEDGVGAQSLLREGRSETVIPAVATQSETLTVVGRLGRPALRRLATGSSFRRLMAAIAAPLLFVPVARIPPKRLLVCAGGLSYAADLERLSNALAKALGASLTLLHVVEPVTLDYPLAKQVEARWQDLLETDTPQARNLRAAVDEATESGLTIEVKIRRGSPVREILNELRTGDYDLVGLGSPHSTHGLRHLALPNVTAEVAEAARCPVLSVRYLDPAENASQAEG